MEPTRINTEPTGPRPWVFVSVVAAALALSGCKAGPKNFDNENDTLRREVTSLRDEVLRLKGENSDLRAQAAQAMAALKASGAGGAAQVIEAMPRCAAVEIGSRSGVSRSDAGMVEVLVETLDVRRRFVQVAGTLTVDVTRLAGEGEAGPTLLGSVTLDAAGLREAYRSSFMGTHYAVMVPVRSAAAGSVVLRAALRDAVTGQTLEGTRVLTVK